MRERELRLWVRYIEENYSKIRDVEREFGNLTLEMKLTAGPKKAGITTNSLSLSHSFTAFCRFDLLVLFFCLQRWNTWERRLKPVLKRSMLLSWKKMKPARFISSSFMYLNVFFRSPTLTLNSIVSSFRLNVSDILQFFFYVPSHLLLFLRLTILTFEV